jgi:hypothetical protein
MAGHYASADVGHVLKQANLVLNRTGTESYGTEEYLVLRGKCMTHRTSHGTGG